MPEEFEPPDGLALQDALLTYADPEMVKAWEEASQAAVNLPRIVTHGSPEGQARRRVTAEYWRVVQDLWARFETNELEAWGAEGSPTVARKKISNHAWPYLEPKSLTSSTLDGPNGLRIYGVRVHRRAEIDEWRNGVQLDRAAELLVRDSWMKFKETYTPLLVIGDPISERHHSEALVALKKVREALWSALTSRQLELRTLHPPDDPSAKWALVSPDVFRAIEKATVDFRDSTVEFPNRERKEVWVFLSAPMDGQKAPPNAGSEAAPEQKRPLGRPTRKGEIESAWEDLLKAKEINFDSPQIYAIRKVRLEVLRISPRKEDNGLGNEAIRKIISKKFQAEKHKRNRGP